MGQSPYWLKCRRCMAARRAPVGVRSPDLLPKWRTGREKPATRAQGKLAGRNSSHRRGFRATGTLREVVCLEGHVIWTTHADAKSLPLPPAALVAVFGHIIGRQILAEVELARQVSTSSPIPKAT